MAECFVSFISSDMMCVYKHGWSPLGRLCPGFVVDGTLSLNELFNRVGPDDGPNQVPFIWAGIFLLHSLLSPANTNKNTFSSDVASCMAISEKQHVSIMSLILSLFYCSFLALVRVRLDWFRVSLRRLFSGTDGLKVHTHYSRVIKLTRNMNSGLIRRS